MQFVKGPDFPTGALILGRSGILDAYRTGRGSVRMRAVAEIIEERNTTQIVVTEIPYQTAVESIDQQVADALERGDLSGITATQDVSAGRETRYVITLKRDANANVVLNNLYKHTQLQTSFGIHMLALVDGVPRLVNLAAGARRLHRPPGRGRHPAVGVPPATRRGIARTSSRDCCGDRHARRGHRDDSRARTTAPRRGPT